MIPSEIRVHATAKRNKDPTNRINSVSQQHQHSTSKEPNREKKKTAATPTTISSSISLLPLSSHKRSQTTDEDLHFRIILLTHLHIIGATSSGISILTLLSYYYQQYDHYLHQQIILDSQGSSSAGPTTN